MLRNFKLYLDIALFRRGPEDLPVSLPLLLLTMAACVTFALLPLQFPAPDGSKRPDEAFAMVVVQAVIELAWYWALLRLAGRPERLLQTGSALFGVELIASVALFIVLVLVIVTQGAISPLPTAAELLMYAIYVWALVLNVRITQAATQWPMFKVVLSVIAQGLVILLVRMALFPDSVKALMPEAAPT